MDKYEYLTCQDLEYKPGVVEKPKFEYSPLDQALKKGFKKKMIKAIRLLNMVMTWFIILCITLINIVCLILMKYHQLALNLMH